MSLTLTRVFAGLALLVGFTSSYSSQTDGLDLELSKGGADQTTQAPPAPRSDGYRISAGDRVSVTIYREPDLDLRDALVREDGTLRFALLGSLQVRGLTGQELEQLLTERLADGYLKQPSVGVNVDAYRLYYIKGQVQRPGGYSYVEGLTVDKAVALAGGFTERASEDDIKLARDADAGARVENAAPNTPVAPGDVITIGESFF